MSAFTPEMFLRPVEGTDDTFRFDYGFGLSTEGKAVQTVEPETITETDDGDLIIEGYAAVFEGVDREGENFTDGAFQRGIKSFLGGQAALCFHHKHDQVIGKVLDLTEEEGKGLRMRARVDGAIKGDPVLGRVYRQIKNGTINALSVGGFFKRKLTESGWKIADCDFTEISATAVPVHPGTNFAVVAGKALASDLEPGEHVKVPKLAAEEIRDEDFMWAQEAIASLDRIFTQIAKRGQGQKDNTDSASTAE